MRRPRRRRATAAGSRHVPAEVRRVVWKRDGGQCAFVSPAGRRCPARGKLEFHHVEPYGVGGPPTVANIQLRCAAHNNYEAVLFHGLSIRPSTFPGDGNLLRAPSALQDSASPVSLVRSE
jgi:hypothetical protein